MEHIEEHHGPNKNTIIPEKARAKWNRNSATGGLPGAATALSSSSSASANPFKEK